MPIRDGIFVGASAFANFEYALRVDGFVSLLIRWNVERREMASRRRVVGVSGGM